MYRCESLTIKKAKGQRIDVFELWCWRRLLRVPWTARSNQSILKEVISEYSLEGLMLKLKLQTFGYLMQRSDSAKIPDGGKHWGQGEERATEDEMVGWHHLTQWTWVWANFRKWWSTGKPGVLQSMGLQRAAHVWVNNNNNNVLWSVQIVCQTSEQRPHGSEGRKCEVIWRKCVRWTEITPRWKDMKRYLFQKIKFERKLLYPWESPWGKVIRYSIVLENLEVPRGLQAILNLRHTIRKNNVTSQAVNIRLSFFPKCSNST